MSKEIWIVIAAILALLSPYICAKFSGTEKELLGWADNFLPKSVATSPASEDNTSETDLWIPSSQGV